ncbi:hypothetical protein [Massilia sp. ST3]|uniref:hypothetical protein n=1 Tax=Massilia sp. ST3 TaxID=2824903 RepID=UPI001B845650|nr:hypothetical protein [Massilia sp. ST3]MBQ5949952.1 hypothetical protein [Massilia sp. ST3]
MRPSPSEPGSVPSATPDLRRDLLQRDVVARGLALLRDCGTLAALEFLKRHAVQPQVIERVLLDPGRRAAA